MTQPSLLPDFAPRVALAPSGVRQVSRAAYQQLKDSGTLGKRMRIVLTGLEDYYAAKGSWPTVPELTRWLYQNVRIWKDDTKLVAPRVSDAVNKLGVLELLPLRTCAVTHSRAHAVRILQR